MVPEISRFFGIVVAMYYDDHPPPHVHVRYGEHRAILEIGTAAVLFGDLPHRVLGMVVEWSEAMLKDVVEVRPLGGYRLYLRFEDGVAGELDLGARLRFEGVFAPLKDPATFARVRIHPDLGTIVWPNGADLDPDVLYAELSRTPISVPPAPTRRTR